MGYFVDPDRLHRLWLRDIVPGNTSDDWVDIVDELAQYDRRAIQSATFSLDSVTTAASGSDIDVGGRARLDAQMITTLTRAIRAWSLTDNAGTIMPCDARSYKRLNEVGEYIERAIERHYRRHRLGAQQLGKSAPSSETGTPAGLGLLPNAPTLSSLDGSATGIPVASTI